MIKLPGVGRKTANVILNTYFNKPFIAVDTHLFRLGNRIGLAKGKNVLEVENNYLKIIPNWAMKDAHHWLILHGRYVCKARNPECNVCKIKEFCEFFKKRFIMVKKVLGMGNAVLDILVETSDSYLQKNNLSKGSMVLVEQEESDKIVNDVTPTKKDSGGSVANSMVGISVLGGSASFCGKVKNDELGQDFEKECKSLEHSFFVLNQTVDYQRQDVLC